MAIRRRRSNSVIRNQGNGRVRSVSKNVVDYSSGYMELITKAQESLQLADPFVELYEIDSAAYRIVEPVYAFRDLINIYIESTILRQCVEAYKVNIESYGYVWEYVGKEGKQNSKEAKAEKAKLESLINRMTGGRCTLEELRENSRIDYEVLGWRTFEVGRNVDGEITLFDHIPASTLRMTKKDPDSVDVDVEIINYETGDVETHTISRTFRRFVQYNAAAQKRVYFKEFGDPRNINPDTGKEDNSISPEDAATEIYVDAQYVPGHVYGLPRWAGQLPAILGSKEAELVNLNFFRENAIPAMAVLVSGGALTEESFQKLEAYILALKGQKSMNRVLVLEAAADDAAGGIDHSQPAPKIELKPMISERQQDGLFRDYDEHNNQKIRSSFRLPPIFVGRAEDYTRASAFASMQTAENQIFIPERMRFDTIVNKKILSTYKPKYWVFKSLGAPLSDPDAISKILKALGDQGALTPNTVIKVANKLLDVDIETIPDEWGDVPFQIIVPMVKSGIVIKGLDSFIKSAKNDLNNVDDPDPEDNSTQAEIKRIIKREVSTIVDDISSSIIESLQTFAEES